MMFRLLLAELFCYIFVGRNVFLKPLAELFCYIFVGRKVCLKPLAEFSCAPKMCSTLWFEAAGNFWGLKNRDWMMFAPASRAASAARMRYAELQYCWEALLSPQPQEACSALQSTPKVHRHLRTEACPEEAPGLLQPPWPDQLQHDVRPPASQCRSWPRQNMHA